MRACEANFSVSRALCLPRRGCEAATLSGIADYCGRLGLHLVLPGPCDWLADFEAPTHCASLIPDDFIQREAGLVEYYVQGVKKAGTSLILIGATFVAALLLAMNGIGLRVLYTRGSTGYRHQASVMMCDMLSTVTGFAAILVGGALQSSLFNAKPVCASTAQFVAFAWPFPVSASLFFAALLIQIAVCLDRLQAIVDCVEYQLANEWRRLWTMNLVAHGCGILVTAASMVPERSHVVELPHELSRTDGFVQMLICERPLDIMGVLTNYQDQDRSNRTRLDMNQQFAFIIAYFGWWNWPEPCKVNLYSASRVWIYIILLGLLNVVLLVLTILLAAAFSRTLKKRIPRNETRLFEKKKSEKEALRARKKWTQDSLVTSVVLVEAALQLLQTAAAVGSQVVWSVASSWGDAADLLLYAIVVLQLGANFFTPLVLSKSLRKETKAVICLSTR